MREEQLLCITRAGKAPRRRGTCSDLNQVTPRCGPNVSRSSSSFHHTALLSLDASPKRTSAPLRFPPKNPLSPKHQ